MEFWSDYGAFLLKTLTLVGAFIVVLGAIVAASLKSKGGEEGELKVTKLNDLFKGFEETLNMAILDKDTLKERHKQQKKQEKEQQKAAKAKKSSPQDSETDNDSPEQKPRVYVLNFEGDKKASAVEHLSKEITAVLKVASKQDEIVVRLESPGGMVHTYGLAASQLQRIREQGLNLTICVDKVAASGGYMMAAVGQTIIAAPFAILGSIGVVAQLPNVHRLLKKNDVDVELFTAGEYKRTVTVLGENTEKGRQKFQQDLEDTHVLFKQFVKDMRPKVDIDAVADGDIWYGSQAIENQLIDRIQTSDQYLLERSEEADIYEIEYERKKSLPEKLGMAAESSLERAWVRVFNRNPNTLIG